ncbi:MAG: hypothetical protein V3R26_01050, partial [Hyphomicrobium sp.]
QIAIAEIACQRCPLPAGVSDSLTQRTLGQYLGRPLLEQLFDLIQNWLRAFLAGSTKGRSIKSTLFGLTLYGVQASNKSQHVLRTLVGLFGVDELPPGMVCWSSDSCAVQDWL